MILAIVAALVIFYWVLPTAFTIAFLVIRAVFSALGNLFRGVLSGLVRFDNSFPETCRATARKLARMWNFVARFENYEE